MVLFFFLISTIIITINYHHQKYYTFIFQHPRGSFADLRNIDLVNSHLQFKEELKKQAEDIIIGAKKNFTLNHQNKSVEQESMQFIGVHVRRGDWEKHFW